MRLNGRLAATILWMMCPPLVLCLPVQTIDPREALSLYEAKDFVSFAALVDSPDALKPDSLAEFQKAADAWIRDKPDRDRRWIAATVALEFAHRLRSKPSEWPAQYLVWATKEVRDEIPQQQSAVALHWYRAALAGMVELNDPWALSAGEESGSAKLRGLARSLGRGGLLELATQRFPDEPRFKIAMLEREEWARTMIEPVPEYLELVQANARLRLPSELKSTEDVTRQSVVETAVWGLQAVEAASRMRDAYTSLRLPPEFAPEIQLHLGALTMRTGAFTEALRLLQSVQDTSRDPYLLYLSNHFQGRALHYLGRRADAVGAFDRALQLFPRSRASATWLSALLFLSDDLADRERAAELMSTSYRGAAADDPWNFYGKTEAWRWQINIEALRRVLR